MKVTCDRCDKQYELKEKFAGKEIECKQCGSTIKIPESWGEDEDLDLELEDPASTPNEEDFETS